MPPMPSFAGLWYGSSRMGTVRSEGQGSAAAGLVYRVGTRGRAGRAPGGARSERQAEVEAVEQGREPVVEGDHDGSGDERGEVNAAELEGDDLERL